MEPQDVPVYPVLAFHTGALDVFVLYKSTFIYLLTYLLTYLVPDYYFMLTEAMTCKEILTSWMSK